MPAPGYRPTVRIIWPNGIFLLFALILLYTLDDVF